jgi:hypothetical protein
MKVKEYENGERMKAGSKEEELEITLFGFLFTKIFIL